jgi:hypothetical protein
MLPKHTKRTETGSGAMFCQPATVDAKILMILVDYSPSVIFLIGLGSKGHFFSLLIGHRLVFLNTKKHDKVSQLTD